MTANSKDDKKENDGFSNSLMYNTQHFSFESLKDYCNKEFESAKNKEELMFYLGKQLILQKSKFNFIAALMFPYEMKLNISDFIIKTSNFLKSAKEFLGLPEVPTAQDFEAIIDSIYEVLYKFSYQKMKTFCKVPELATLYINFFETLEKQNETSYNVAQEIKDYCG